jgi:hypothetical protein
MERIREIERKLMRLDIERPHHAESADRQQYLSDFVNFQRMLARCDCGKLIEDLNAITPHEAMSSSARLAFLVSPDNRYKRILVSKKTSATLMGFQPIELEVGRQTIPVLP